MTNLGRIKQRIARLGAAGMARLVVRECPGAMDAYCGGGCGMGGPDPGADCRKCAARWLESEAGPEQPRKGS